MTAADIDLKIDGALASLENARYAAQISRLRVPAYRVESTRLPAPGEPTPAYWVFLHLPGETEGIALAEDIVVESRPDDRWGFVRLGEHNCRTSQNHWDDSLDSVWLCERWHRCCVHDFNQGLAAALDAHECPLLQDISLGPKASHFFEDPDVSVDVWAFDSLGQRWLFNFLQADAVAQLVSKSRHGYYPQVPGEVTMLIDNCSPARLVQSISHYLNEYIGGATTRLTSRQVQELVDAGLAQFSDQEEAKSIRALLVKPWIQMRNFSYAHEPGERPDCANWIFLEFPNSSDVLAYSKQGFGKPGRDSCWGVVDLDDPSYDQDSLWHPTLEEVWNRFGRRILARCIEHSAARDGPRLAPTEKTVL